MQPEEYCPICGVYIKDASTNAGNYFNHRCSKRVLGSINGARTRESNDTEVFRNITEPPFGDKLTDAFNMVDPDRDEEEFRILESKLKAIG